MGGEASIMAAISSLKNNRNLISKRKERNALSRSYAHVQLAVFPEATPEKLRMIRNRIKRGNQQLKVKQLIAFVVLLVIVISIFVILD
jgi:hypothetical protein